MPRWTRSPGSGPAARREALFQPADEDDLVAFLKAVPEDVPLTIGRRGFQSAGARRRHPGLCRQAVGEGFRRDRVNLAETRFSAGAAVPDKRVAAFAYEAGIGGFHFYHGIPGAVGGALRMNAGANGVETRERVVEVRAVDRKGEFTS